MIVLVRQPPGSNLCGQACIATLCNVSLEQACNLAGTYGQTNTAHLKRVLRACSFPHGDRRVLGFPPDHVTALMFWRSADNREAHWMLWYNRKYYDPIAGVFRHPPRHVANSRVTSYLVVGEQHANQI